MQKAKKEDFKAEEELRSQKAKYEETSEDVYRRMQDVSAFSLSSLTWVLNNDVDQRSRSGQHC